MTTASNVVTDLEAEHEALDAVVADLDDAGWRQSTASPRWTVAHQIAHLSYFDRAAATAITDPELFAQQRDELFASAAGGDEAVDELTLEPGCSQPGPELLAHWREGRTQLVDGGRTLGDDDRVEWYGPSMGAKSFLTARLMETWAHGQDVVDTVGGRRPATDRLRHIAQLGVITRGWTYANRGQDPPEGDVRVELTAPSGAEWAWGAADAEASVKGGAEAFCLVVTQRRHVGDTELVVEGHAATDWLAKAQAFAGPATDGPGPGGH
jgi:uncharacterized protein (TIGR03084 family)